MRCRFNSFGLFVFFVFGLLFSLSLLVPSSVQATPIAPDSTSLLSPEERHVVQPDTSSLVVSHNVDNPIATELISSFGGRVDAVAVEGNHAYISEVDKLTILDISTPSKPVWVSSISLPSEVEDVFVESGFAYVPVGSSGLQIVDVTNPALPVLVGSYDTSDSATEVYVNGTTAYVMGSFDGVKIVDVSIPSNPTLVATYGDDQIYDAQVIGDTAYLAAGWGGLQIIDVSNLTSPKLLGTYDRPVHTMDVVGNYAYVSDGWGGLHIVDVRDPTNPVFVEEYFYYTYSYPDKEIQVFGNYLYIRDNWYGDLQIIDVTDPRNPVLVKKIDGHAGYDMQIVGNYAYFAFGGDGLRILDISNPSTLELVGHYDFGNMLEIVPVVDTKYYIWSAAGNLHLLDMSISSSPQIVHSFDTPGIVQDVQVIGNRAYVADGDSGLSVLDVSNIAEPTLVATFDTPGYAEAVYVSNQTAYIADKTGLLVLDVSNLANIQQTASFETSYAVDVYVDNNNLAYVADWDDGLLLVDVSTTTPMLEGSFATSGDANNVQVVDSYAYVRVGSPRSYYAGGNLSIIDVSTPTTPTLVDSFDTGGYSEQFYVTGNYAYLPDTFDGLQILNVSTPTTPTLAGSHNAYGSGVYVVDNLIYATNEDDGLDIIWFGDSVQNQNISHLDVLGPSSGTTNQSYSFQTKVVPTTATTPTISYTWFPEPTNGQGDANVTYTWAITGTYTLVVTATNATESVSKTHDIIISDPIVPADVVIHGETEGKILTNYFFNAVVSPTNITKPFTYTWFPEPLNGQGSASTIYYWKESGTHTVTVTIDNGFRSVSTAHAITIEPPIAPSAIDIVAPTQGLTTTNLMYKAVVSPTNATIPVTYSWSPEPTRGQGSLDATYHWDKVGIYTVSVTATNVAGSATSSHTITITEPISIEYVGSIGGGLNVGVIDGNYAYIGEGYGLTILDMQDPIQPVRLSRLLLSDELSDIQIENHLAYITTGGSGLQIVDVSNPAMPKHVASYDTPDDAIGIHVIDSTAYVADWNGGMQVLNVSNPVSPTFVVSHNAPGPVRDVQVVGTTAYVAHLRRNGLQIVDMSTPTNPIVKSTFDLPDTFEDMQVVGDYVYITVRYAGLLIVDVSDPSQPKSIGVYDTPGSANGVDVVGDYAYIADWHKGLHILDVSTPTTPTLVNSLPIEGYSQDVQVVGNYAYISTPQLGLQIVDVSNLDALTLVDYFDIPDVVKSVQVIDNTAYVAGGEKGLHILDVSNPQKPLLIGSYDTLGSANSVQVIDTLAYIADDTAGLQIIDVSNPTLLQYIGSYDTLGIAYNVQVVGNYAYVADYSSGLQIIDVSIPTNPTLIGHFDSTDSVYDVRVIDTIAYIAAENNGLEIVDVSTPTTPTLISSFDTVLALNLDVVGSTAYIADGYSGLQIVDVSNITTPTFVSRLDNNYSYVTDVMVVDKTVYIEDNDEGLQVLDIHNPKAPIILGGYDTPKRAKTLYAVNDLVFIADQEGGLQIVWVGDSDTNESISFIGINGKSIGLTHTPYEYYARAIPSIADLPITYTWSPIPVSGQGTAHASYTWQQAGTYTITVTAENSMGSVTSDEFEVIIAEKMVALAGVTIHGDTAGVVNTTHSLTATVVPITSTIPITYTWSPAPAIGQGTANVTYSWNSEGTYVVTVTAQNSLGEVTSEEFTVTVSEPTIAPTGVKVSGNTTGVVNTSSTYTATVEPANVTTPLVYTWSPVPASGQGTAHATYTWQDAGSYDIKVTAKNSAGSVSSELLTVTVSDKPEPVNPVPPTSVTMSGNTSGWVNTTYAFTATVVPTTTTTPITYTWGPAPNLGQGTANARYTWQEVGTYTIMVTVANSVGSVSSEALQITISDKPDTSEQIAPTSVSISGDTEGVVHTSYMFTATVAPTNTTLPITYTWSPQPTSGQGKANAMYAWETMGTYSISVTVKNQFGAVQDTHTIQIADEDIPSDVQEIGTVTSDGGTIRNNDGRVQLDIPAGAVNTPITIHYSEQATSTHPLKSGYLGVRFFTLETTEGSSYQFQKPITITMSYTDAEWQAVTDDESSLTAQYWNGMAWQDIYPCLPEACGVQVDTDRNVLVIVTNHFTDFAIVSQEATMTGNTYVYLPCIMR